MFALRSSGPPALPMSRVSEAMASCRIWEVKRLKAFVNCLKKGQGPQDCYYSTCRNCGKRHNTLLHLGGQGEKQGPTASPDAQDRSRGVGSSQEINSAPSTSQQETQQISGAITTHSIDASFVLLSMAWILLFSDHDKSISCQVLLDNGSQSCFITSKD